MLRGMRSLLSALLVMVFCLGACPAISAGADEETGGSKQLLRGLVRKGAEAVQKKMDAQLPKDEQAAQNKDKVELTKMAATLLSPGGLTAAMREVVAETLEAVKEQYKEEGRVYARQLGDALAERIVQNPKVQGALFMVKTLAWAVMIYLTVVTLLLLICLRKLYVGNHRILELLEERRRS